VASRDLRVFCWVCGQLVEQTGTATRIKHVHDSWCRREHEAAKQASYHRNHAEQLNAATRQRYWDNPEYGKQRNHEYKQANLTHVQEKDKLSTRRYRANPANKEKLLESRRKYYKNKPEAILAAAARRRQKANTGLDKRDKTLSTAYRKAIRNDVCYYCSKPGGHTDHFFPLAKGGKEVWYNLVRACQSCNLKKNAHCGTWFLLKMV
jgi:5-methylcytosine-specific restriction endonuclease McrA